MRRSPYTRGILVLGLNQMIETIAFGIPYSYFPRYAVSLGASVASIGLFTSSFMFMSAMLSPYLGTRSDRFGRKRLMIIGLIGDVIFGALTGLVPSWEWLILIRALNGAATAAAVIPAEALLIDLAPRDRIGEATGFVMACATVGRNIGPLFGGTVQWLSVSSGFSELESYRIPYFVDAGLAGLSALLVALGIKERKIATAEKKEHSEKKRFKIPRPFKVLLVVAFVTGIGEGFIRPIMALFFGDIFGAEPIEIGLLMTLSGFIAICASWLSGKGSDRFGRKIVIALGGVPARLLGTALALSLDFNTASIIYTARGFMWRIYMVGLRSLRADLAPLEIRGRLFGLYRTFFDLGDIIGPIMATYLYDVYRFETFQIGGYAVPGYGVPFYLNTTIGLIVVVILLVFVRYGEPPIYATASTMDQ
ncbi:MAG: MFS transporter [Candidatus Bathyarchaeota archaeon]|nr:MFS transporter [Candidatus Bathyarchaeota archaeon]MDH5687047.1 MFS transporter [Candidatus Bathyarchaeota archaeon]